MTPEPLLHESTARTIQQIIDSPPHGILLTGAAGIGKQFVAHWLLKQLYTGPNYIHISSVDGKAIGIESVRQLEHFVSLRVASSQAVNRAIVISDAHRMTVEAQNALLKTLEEPPRGTIIIMTSSNLGQMLPTITSRLQIFPIQKPTTEQLSQALPSNLTAADKQQILQLSGGLPGLAFSLVDNDQEHPLKTAVQAARSLLQSTIFERLIAVDKLAKDKTLQANIPAVLSQMAHAALATGRSPERWQQVLLATNAAQDDLARGAQAKLALTKLMLEL